MKKKCIINIYHKRIYTLQRMLLKLVYDVVALTLLKEILELMHTLFVHVAVSVVIIRKSYNYNLYT